MGERGTRQEKGLTFRGFLKTLALGILALFLVTLVGAYYRAGEIYEYQDTMSLSQLGEVDAIVCLAGGRGRITAAGDLWQQYWELAHGSKAGANSTDRGPSSSVT